MHEQSAASADDAVSIDVRPIAEHATSATASGSATATSPPASQQADVVVEEVYRTAGAAHAPMEPHAALADVGGRRGWSSSSGTQTPFNTRADLAGLFGIDEERIRVIAPPMGGSFGAKTFVRLEALVAALARKAGRPVKAVLDRAEEFVTLNRHPAVVRVRIGARRDGTLVAKEVDCWCDTGAYADCGPGRGDEDGLRRRRPVPDPERAGRLAVDLHQPSAQRRLPRLRRDAVGVGVRAHDGPAGRASST